MHACKPEWANGLGRWWTAHDLPHDIRHDHARKRDVWFEPRTLSFLHGWTATLHVYAEFAEQDKIRAWCLSAVRNRRCEWVLVGSCTWKFIYHLSVMIPLNYWTLWCRTMQPLTHWTRGLNSHPSPPLSCTWFFAFLLWSTWPGGKQRDISSNPHRLSFLFKSCCLCPVTVSLTIIMN